MTFPWPPALRRSLAVALVLLAVAALWVTVIVPLRSAHEELDERIEQAKRLLTAYRQAAAARPALETSLARLQRLEADQPGAVVSASAAQAAAALQKDIRAILDGAGGTVQSVQALPPVTADGFEAIDIRYQLTAPMSGLATIVHQLETHRPYLFLREVDIRVPDYATPGAAATEPRLTIRWTVRGYRRLEAS